MNRGFDCLMDGTQDLAWEGQKEEAPKSWMELLVERQQQLMRHVVKCIKGRQPTDRLLELLPMFQDYHLGLDVPMNLGRPMLAWVVEDLERDTAAGKDTAVLVDYMAELLAAGCSPYALSDTGVPVIEHARDLDLRNWMEEAHVNRESGREVLLQVCEEGWMGLPKGPMVVSPGCA